MHKHGSIKSLHSKSGIASGISSGSMPKTGSSDATMEYSALPASQEQRERNIKALLSGNVVVRRKPCLGVFRRPVPVLVRKFKPFKPPYEPTVMTAEIKALRARKSLGIRRNRMNFNKFKQKAFTAPVQTKIDVSGVDFSDIVKDEPEVIKPDIVPPVKDGPILMCDRHVEKWERLLLWEPDTTNVVSKHEEDSLITSEASKKSKNASPVEVPEVVCKWLRSHQREGVQFMFECLAGLRDFDGSGCILADDMGLGKSLQAIAVMWTLMNGMPRGEPVLRRTIIVCPTSLVANWRNELNKWLGSRIKVIALTESGQLNLAGVRRFLRTFEYQVLAVSYETFRKFIDMFQAEDACDLLICDEAHRLKNGQTQTSLALSSLNCRKRVLLTGTPMQNDLEEFFAMVNFTNPGVLVRFILFFFFNFEF